MRKRAIDSTAEWLVAALGDLGEVEARRMFGARGVYLGDVMFAIVDNGRVYFKVDDDTRPEYEAAGSKPFRPKPKQTLKTFYEVPVEVLEDAELLRDWAAEAAEVAARAKK